MSLTGSLLTYENNNHIINKTKKRNSSICSSDLTQSVDHHTLNSMGKIGTTLNSGVLKTDLSVITKHQQAHPRFKTPHLQTTYMNSRRKHSKYSNIHRESYSNNNNYLHLNSLWSIWYGVLLTLFQGYLAIHGASRFLACSLIQWKIEPVTELNLQIVLAGLVFVLLPFFFTSAVFKVGNMANDGVKLATSSKDRIFSKTVQDGFGEKSHIGSMKTLWVHGGPTAAFIHIVIALCLLLPRLLLEGRIIENGFLPRETIWHTELDFLVVNRNNLVVLSIKSSQYQNTTLIETLENEISPNDTKVDIQTNIHKNSTNYLHTNLTQEISAKKKISHLTDAAVAINDSNIFLFSKKWTINPTVTSKFAVDLWDIIGTTNEDVKTTSIFEDNGAVTIANSTQNYKRITKKENKLISFPAHLVSSYYNKQNNKQNNHNGKIVRKHNRKERKPHQQFHSNEKNVNFDFLNKGNLNNISLSKKSPRFTESKANKVNQPYLQFSTTTGMGIRDSNIHIVKPEKLPEIVPSSPVSSNSKIIEIKQKIKRAISSKDTNHVKIEPELFLNDSSEYVAEIDSIESYTTTTLPSTLSNYNEAHLDGFAGMLQLVFGIKKSIDVNTFNNPPSAEFLNLLFALLVWCVRYPAVFWTTAKSFATIFSVQMIASAADIIFSYVGVSSLFKLHIYSQRQPIHNQGLVLNASVTLALFLLSVVLILSSSMVLYLFGHGRLSAKMRDRSIITLSSNKSWIYFAHCSSLCYILALSVVKAPLLNDLSITYRNSLHCPTFVAALVSVMYILLWAIIWIILTVKSKWSFKLPPLDTYPIIGKATTKPILMHNMGCLADETAGILSNSANPGIGSSAPSVNNEIKLKCGNTGNFFTTTSSSEIINDALDDEIYWPNTTPSSPKLKVTFNEVTSTSDEHEQSNDKRNSFSRTSVYFTSIKGEIDDGEYATLRSDPTTLLDNISEKSCKTKNSSAFNTNHRPDDNVDRVHLNECNELPPPPPNMTSPITMTNHMTTVSVDLKNNYVNFIDDCVSKDLGDDNISEDGKLIERMLDGSMTYASVHNIEPPVPLPATSKKILTSNNDNVVLKERSNQITECNQLSPSTEYLISPLAPVKVDLHTNEEHIFHNATSRCLRSADSGVAHEALSPRSDTNSFGTEYTISPPERAPSESSSGIHSAEEREIEVVIRPRVMYKKTSKLPPPVIQEEPNNRCTNMRMSSFAGGSNLNTLNSATLPTQRSNADEKFDFSQLCSTMPLPTSHKENDQQIKTAVYAASAQCMSKTQNTFSNVSSFKTPLYANSGFAVSGHKPRLYDQNFYNRTIISTHPQLTHTILSNGVRYSTPNILRRHPFLKISDPQSSLANSTIREDRDSANYSMVSDQESIYATANSLC